MLKKNDLVTVEISDLTTEGEGIGKAGAFPLFIKDTMPGDRVRAVVTKLKKNYGYGKALEILAPSADRIPMRCPIARRCGGCQIQEMDYQAVADILNVPLGTVKSRLLRARLRMRDCLKSKGNF